MYNGIVGLTKTDGVNMVFKNLPNITRSVDRINEAFNETFIQKFLDGQFIVEDLFSESEKLRHFLQSTSMSNELINDLLNGSFNLTEIYQTFNETVNIEPFCRDQFLNHLLTIDNQTTNDLLVQSLCHINIRNLTTDLNYFLTEYQPDVLNNYVSYQRKLLEL